MYLFHNHGYSNNTRDHFLYDLDNNTLETLPAIPGIADYPSTQVNHGIWPVEIGGKIYVGPFYHESGQYAIASLNTSSKTWAIEHYLDKSILPFAIAIFGTYPSDRNFGQMASAFGNTILYFGEFGFYRYDVVTKSASQSSSSTTLAQSGAIISSFKARDKTYMFSATNRGDGDLYTFYSTVLTSPNLTEAKMLQGTSCYSQSWGTNPKGSRVSVVDNVPYYVAGNSIYKLSLF